MPPGGVAVVLEFRVLGAVAVARDGLALPLGPRRQRLVLLRLLLDAGRPVPLDRLIEDVWGGRPPDGAVRTLRSYLSRLRAALGTTDVIACSGSGYLLHADVDAVDSARFEALAREGSQLLRRHNAAAAAARLREALGLWRGAALADVPPEPFVLAEASRLEELRIAALEDRIEADLALGRHSQLVPELETAVAQHPLRERLWGQLMVALYRAERQGDALEAYRRARRVLDEELGVEPGEELRRLEAAVLRHELPDAHVEPADNLPTPLTGFIGRQVELEELLRTLARSRLVTIVGPGGCGKTRIAVEAAAQCLERFPDGRWMVDLASLSDPALLAQTVAAALDVVDHSGRPSSDVLVEHLRRVEALLVLDNCEHLAEGCAVLVQHLVEGCRGLRVLATSREALGVPGEVLLDLHPLPAPPTDHDGDAGDYDAVRLFLARSPATVPPSALPAVARICRELDGLPLAIEIAAAQTSVLSPSDIADRLADRFRLLTYWSRTAVPRHATLRASLDWSYTLLQPAERALFHRLGLFAGGFTLPAVEAVAEPRTTVLPTLRRLVDASLAQRDGRSTVSRFRLLETVRQYARERAVAAGDAEHAARRHAEFFATLADRALAAVDGPDEADVHAEVEADLANLRTALDWSYRTGEVRLLVRLARGTGSFWRLRGYLDEGETWLTRALERGRGAPPEVRADLVGLLGFIDLRRNDFRRARERLAEAVELARAAGTGVQQGYWLHKLAFCHRAQGEHRAAQGLLTEAVDLARAHGARANASHALGSLADMAMLEGRYADAERLYDEAWSLAQPAPPGLEVPYLHSTACLALARGDLDRASARARDGLTRAAEAGDQWHVGLNLTCLAAIAHRRGDTTTTRRLLGEALDALWPLRDVSALTEALDVLAVSLLDGGPAADAVVVAEAALSLRERVGVPPGTFGQVVDADDRDALRALLGRVQSDGARTAGAALVLDDVVELARSAVRQASAPAPARPPSAAVPAAVP